MDCRETLERLSDFRDGSLCETAMKGVSLHIGKCKDCAEVARSLDAVRDGLRGLPPVSAPPELFERIREAVALEGAQASTGDGPAADAPARSAFSRLKAPLETAAAVLLLASAYWYWTGTSAPVTAIRPSQQAAPPAEVASAAPVAAVPPAPVRVARTSPRTVPAPAPALRAAEPENRNGERSIATLPEGTPDPKVRAYSLADLPASPVLRASTRFSRVLPVDRADAPAEESRAAGAGEAPQAEPSGSAAQASRLRPPVPYGRDVSLEVAPEDREEAAERIRETARRLGGSVEGTDRVASEGTVAVRVLLQERTSQAFLDELGQIGRIPPEGMPARSVFPAGPTPGTVAYSVRLRAR